MLEIDLQPTRWQPGSWLRGELRLLLRLSNPTGQPLLLMLEGRDETGELSFIFELPQEASRHLGQIELALAPGTTRSLTLIVTSRAAPFSLRPIDFTLVARPLHGAVPEQLIPGRIMAAPTTSPLLIAALLGAFLCGGLLLPFFPAGPVDGAVAVDEGGAAPFTGALSVPTVGQVVIPRQELLPTPDKRHASSPQVDPGALATVAAILATQAPPPTATPAPVQPAVAPPPPAARSPMSYEQMFKEIGAHYGLDWRVLASIAYHESRFNATAVGKSGDMGLMQIMPTTWEAFAPAVGASDPYDPYSNAMVGAAYLAHQHHRLQRQGYGDLYWALLAYNWGPSNLDRLLDSRDGWAGVPVAKQQYVWNVMHEAATQAAGWWQGKLKEPVERNP